MSAPPKHHPVRAYDDTRNVCADCGQTWPCDVIRLSRITVEVEQRERGES